MAAKQRYVAKKSMTKPGSGGRVEWKVEDKDTGISFRAHDRADADKRAKDMNKGSK